MKTKTLPCSKESEMMVLGCMLTNVTYLNIASDYLQENDFNFIENSTIFSALKRCHFNEKEPGIHVISEDLKNRDQLSSIGVNYLVELVQYAGTSADIEAYCQEVKDHSTLRKMITVFQASINEAVDVPSNVDQFLDETSKKLFDISQSSNFNKGITIAEILRGEKSESGKSYKESFQERIKDYEDNGIKQVSSGIKTHFYDLDRMLDGLNDSNLMILAARPAMGKTALAMNIAENVCFKNKIPVGIFSLEMTVNQLVDRMVSSLSEVSSDKIKFGNCSPLEVDRVNAAIDLMQENVLVIDDQSNLRVSDLRARARRMKEVHDIKLLVIDYLQLITAPGKENRQNEVSEISRLLKGLARELNIPILCLSQLSRKTEDRASQKPLLSDLRDSGSIEQDADIVLLLWRKSYYDPMDLSGTTELNIAKNRHGGTGTVKLLFKKDFAKFCNYTPIEQELVFKNRPKALAYADD